MGLELELSKLDDLDDSTKSLYIKDGEKFKLNPAVADFQKRVGQMDSKISELLTETKQFKSKAREATELAEQKAKEIEEQTLLDLEKNKDFSSYKKNLQEKHDLALKEKDNLVDLYKNIATSQASGHDAMKLASDISLMVNGASTVNHLEPQFAKRLRTVFEDGKAVIQVLDKEGNLSALTQKELQEEIRNLPENGMLVSGSKGKGAGVPANGSGAGSPDWHKFTPRQKIEYARSN